MILPDDDINAHPIDCRGSTRGSDRCAFWRAHHVAGDRCSVLRVLHRSKPSPESPVELRSLGPALSAVDGEYAAGHLVWATSATVASRPLRPPRDHSSLRSRPTRANNVSPKPSAVTRPTPFRVIDHLLTDRGHGVRLRMPAAPEIAGDVSDGAADGRPATSPTEPPSSSTRIAPNRSQRSRRNSTPQSVQRRCRLHHTDRHQCLRTYRTELTDSGSAC